MKFKVCFRDAAALVSFVSVTVALLILFIRSFYGIQRLEKVAFKKKIFLAPFSLNDTREKRLEIIHDGVYNASFDITMWKAIKLFKDTPKSIYSPDDVRDTSNEKHYLRPMLCVTFASMEKCSMDILINNFRITTENDACDWIVIYYNMIETDVLEMIQQSAVNIGTNLVFAEVYPSALASNRRRLIKPVLLNRILPFTLHYERVWLLDEDIDLSGFSFPVYQALLTSLNKPTPLLLQILSRDADHYCHPLQLVNWNETELKKSQMIPTRFVEMQAPIVETAFLRWFMLFVLEPVVEGMSLLTADFGLDNIWCHAATQYNALKYGEDTDRIACAVIVDKFISYGHKNLGKTRRRQDITKYEEYELHNHLLVLLMAERFRDWFEFCDMFST